MLKPSHLHILVLVFSLLPYTGFSQGERLSLTLDDAISIANESSLDAFIAENMYYAREWEFRNYRAQKRPFLDLNATPVNFSRAVTQEYNFQDGSYQYIDQQLFNSRGGISLSQNITATGGRIFVDSELSRLGNLNSGFPTQYSSTIVRVGLSQQLFGFNSYKWESRVEPLKFEQAKKDLISSGENIALTAVRYFFEMAREQINLEIAENNVANADSLYSIGQKRFAIASISRENLYTLQLETINSRNELQSAEIRLRRAKRNLYSLLRLDNSVDIELIYPHDLPDIQVDPAKSLEMAIANNPVLLDYRREILESERDVDQARKESRFSTTLSASFGLNQTSTDFGRVYTDPLDQQVAMLNISIPILDWGLSRGRYNLAQKNRDVTEAIILQSKIDFEHNVLMTTEEFNIQQSLVRGAEEADTVARFAFDISMERFMTGHVNVTQLNAVQRQTIDARRNYINALESYWQYYYTLRQLTLYDFEKEKTLMEEFDRKFGW